jgi:hypothetical protein
MAAVSSEETSGTEAATAIKVLRKARRPLLFRSQQRLANCFVRPSAVLLADRMTDTASPQGLALRVASVLHDASWSVNSYIKQVFSVWPGSAQMEVSAAG